jgi:hypothetical protein
MADTALEKRREENLRAMKSPASIALAAIAAVALISAFVFYDHPITHNDQLLSYLRSFASHPG